MCPGHPVKTSTLTDRLVWRQQLEKGENHGTQKCLCASKEFLLWSHTKKILNFFFVWGDFDVYPGKDFQKVLLKID